MIKPDPNTTFSDINLEDFDIPPVPKYVEKRGYIYIVQDSAFPDFFKIGRTQSLKRRLSEYNDDRPYPTVSYTAFSELFTDVLYVEKKILERLYKDTPPTTFTREWFTMEHLPLALELVNQAEEVFNQ